MVDRIKIMLPDYSPNENLNWVKVKNKNFPDKTFYRALLFNRRFDKRRHPLWLLLTANEKTEKFSLSISGSIRKWYFNKNSRSDLKYEEFNDSLNLLANDIGINLETLLNGKVTKIELGLTILLKAKMRRLIDCLIKYRNAEREIFKETTLYFKFGNYKLVFYDKYLEMNKCTKWTKKEEIVFNKFYFLRFEINANKVSGTNLKTDYNTPKKIIENWNSIPSLIENYISDIVFVDVISSKKRNEIRSYSNLKNYLLHLGIKKLVEENNISLLTSVIKNRSDTKKILKAYHVNLADEYCLRANFLFELNKKLKRLIYNKSNI